MIAPEHATVVAQAAGTLSHDGLSRTHMLNMRWLNMSLERDTNSVDRAAQLPKLAKFISSVDE